MDIHWYFKYSHDHSQTLLPLRAPTSRSWGARFVLLGMGIYLLWGAKLKFPKRIGVVVSTWSLLVSLAASTRLLAWSGPIFWTVQSLQKVHPTDPIGTGS